MNGPDAGRRVLRQRLDRLLAGVASRRHIHHAIAAVESSDGSFGWTGTAGTARPDGPPLEAHTPFFIASVDKLFTATLVLQLWEQGRVALDAPMTEYLPRSLTEGLHRFRGVDYSSRITVRHLLGHTSGLPDYLEDRPRGGRSLVDELAADGDRRWSHDDMAQRVRERLTPHFPPQPPDASRTRIRYSDTNYQLLDAILQAVTASPPARAYRDLLFGPLGMRHTWSAAEAGPTAAAPPPATLWFGSRPLVIPGAMASFNGVFSTLGDTTRFLRALVRGELFHHAGTLATMQGRWLRFGLPLDAAALRSPGWPIEYGLGIMRFRLPRVLTPFGRVPAVIGHTGSTGSWLFYCPELQVLLSGTVDQATAGAVPFRFVPRVLRTLLAARDRA